MSQPVGGSGTSSSSFEIPFTIKPYRLPKEPLHIGNQSTHFSHDLFIFQGMLYCNKCGGRALSNRMQKLAAPCGRRMRAGEIVLEAVRAGHLPAGATPRAISKPKHKAGCA